MSENNKGDAAAFYTKLSALRADVHSRDWADDKILSYGRSGGGYGYITTDKIVKQIAPLIPKHGLELEVEYSDLRELKVCGTQEQHYLVTLKVTLIDIDTGFRGNPSTVFGEAADTGDKAVTKALTIAYKNWHLKFFGIADGMDPEAETVDSAPVKRFSRTREEEEEAKSRVLEAARAAQTARAAPKDESVPAAPAAQALVDTGKPAGKAEEKPAEKAAPAPAPQAPGKSGFTPKTPQKNAINKIINDWSELAKAGKVTPDEYNVMTDAYLGMASDSDAVAFIKKFKRTTV